jgi:hypothetical protein
MVRGASLTGRGVWAGFFSDAEKSPPRLRTGKNPAQTATPVPHPSRRAAIDHLADWFGEHL